MKPSCLSVLLFISLLLGAAATRADERAVEIIRTIDEMYRADSAVATLKMHIETPNWQRTLEMQSWSRGMDDTFIRILAPRKDRGVATLKQDREMWNYFPKINKVIKVPPSMMMGSWMGSDFTNDDLVREVSLVEDYHVEMEDRGEQYLLVLTPKQQTVTVWGRIDVLVDKEPLLPLEQVYFNERGDKVRTMSFSDVREFSGKRLPAVMKMVPHNKEGHSTTMEYVELAFGVEIDPSVFSLRNLQQRF